MSQHVPPRPAYALFDWWLRFAVWLLAFLLFAWALSSCSMLGIATEGYVETRVDDVNQHTAKAAGKVAETFETVAPGISSYVEDVFLNEPANPPPAPDPAFPWLDVIGIVGAAFGVSVPAAVKATNLIRDSNRRKFGEATSVPEAMALGQIPAPKAPSGGA